ncbi:cation diffusion facilitator family transporter [Desulfoplanes sp.]
MEHSGVMQARQVRKITWVGLFVNLGLALFKGVAGYIGASQAVMADGVHSLSDCVTDIAVLIGSHYWSRPPDADHPYGHKRFETFVTVLIGLALLGAALGIGWEAVDALKDVRQEVPGWIAVLAAAVSVLANELLYRWSARLGREIKSTAVLANAWHHRLDAVSSIPAFLAVAGAILIPSWTMLDKLGALLVALLILQAACRIIWPGLKELMDWGAPQEICDRIRGVAQAHPEILDAHKIRTRYQSGSIFADMHIVVNGNMPVRDGHTIAEHVRKAVIQEVPEVVDVIVHVDPHQVSRVHVEDPCSMG